MTHIHQHWDRLGTPLVEYRLNATATEVTMFTDKKWPQLKDGPRAYALDPVYTQLIQYAYWCGAANRNLDGSPK